MEQVKGFEAERRKFEVNMQLNLIRFCSVFILSVRHSVKIDLILLIAE